MASPSTPVSRRRKSSRRKSYPQTQNDMLKFDYTKSGQAVNVDPAQIAFKTSSMALLRAKGKINKSQDGNITDPSLEYHNLVGAQKVVNFMNMMYQSSKLCDVLLRASQKDLLAHKLALGAYSNLLADRFSEYQPGEFISQACHVCNRG